MEGIPGLDRQDSQSLSDTPENATEEVKRRRREVRPTSCACSGAKLQYPDNSKQIFVILKPKVMILRFRCSVQRHISIETLRGLTCVEFS